jgi:hypothetical protein
MEETRKKRVQGERKARKTKTHLDLMDEAKDLMKKAEEAHNKILIQLGKAVKDQIMRDFKDFDKDEFIKEVKAIYFKEDNE